MKEVVIPRYIDSQMQLFFWEFDEFIVAAGLLAFGIVTKSFFIAIILIYVFNKMFRRFKDGRLEGILLHVAYWIGLFPLNRVALDGLQRSKVY